MAAGRIDPLDSTGVAFVSRVVSLRYAFLHGSWMKHKFCLAGTSQRTIIGRMSWVRRLVSPDR